MRISDWSSDVCSSDLFLMQSELSQAPSRAQRDMPYRDLDVDAGVEHMQLMGVRYYLARTPEAQAAAEANPDLTEKIGRASCRERVGQDVEISGVAVEIKTKTS